MLDGSPGTRIKPGWGYQGLDPLSDCADGSTLWYSFGTYAASLIGGLRSGVAKNVTIYSVRMRESCMFESPDIWSPGGLPSALDAVLSTFIRPAIIVVDAWWSRGRLDYDDDDRIEASILDRMERAASLEIPIITTAGQGLEGNDPCDNVFSKVPRAVIRVASVGPTDHRTLFGPGNSTCIDIWAPGGDLGGGITGAIAKEPNTYTTVIPRGFGASWLVAGVAAQYLSLYPKSTIQELKDGLLMMGIQNMVVGGGKNLTGRPNVLLHSTLQEQGRSTFAAEAPASSSGDEGMSSGSIIAISVASVAATGIAAGMLIAVVSKRRRAAYLINADMAPTSSRYDWEIDESQIEVCLLPGTQEEWLLGVGQYGRVHRALKDGIQSVAVKTLHVHAEAAAKTSFVQEIAMMQWLSRDPNIVQFYGACVRADNMMLVCELMEVSNPRNFSSRRFLLFSAAESHTACWQTPL
jgi:hypothetical protein